MISISNLLRMNRKEFAELLGDGYAIEPEALENMEYKGVSLGLPEIVDRLTWKTFKKVFHRDPKTGHLRGWNVRIVQRGVDGPYEPQVTRGEPKTFGHYRVIPGWSYKSPLPCPNALMLDYGLGGNGRLDPMCHVRDPIVAVNPGDPELLLGWSFLDFGPFQVKTPSWFCLRRDIPLTHVHFPPR